MILSEHGLLSHLEIQTFESVFGINYQPPVLKNATVNETDTLPPNITDSNNLTHIQIRYKPVCYNCFQSSLSLVFVIDNTGSMSDDIFQVRKQAIGIVNKASSSQHGLADYILITFNDPGEYTSSILIAKM